MIMSRVKISPRMTRALLNVKTTDSVKRRAAGTAEADRRLVRTLWNDPASGIMHHADAGCEGAIERAKRHQLKLPMTIARRRL